MNAVPLSARLFAAPLAFVVVACGGTVDTNLDSGPDGGGSDAKNDSVLPSDATNIPDTPILKPFDGTVGKTCTTDADCHVAGGPNIARCSNSVFSPEDYNPTAVCVLPTCATVSDTTAIHYCDGPDDASSPGVCLPYASGTGNICLPKCTYDKSGGAAVGCAGKNVCWADTGAPEVGVGYCFGGCTQDGDCQDNQKCQVDQGLCVEGVTPPIKSVGTACTKSDTNGLICNCLYGTGNSGYCSSFCITGGAPSCTSGFTCDALELRTYGYTTQNTGMAGYCTKSCSGDGGSCPPSSSCTNVFADGPDCIPP